MEEKETKNKFWKGVLVGVLVTAFSGLAVVGVATGIWTVGRRASESQSTQTAETSGTQLDMNKITPKLQYMEALIDKYFLFDENMTEEEQAKERNGGRLDLPRLHVLVERSVFRILR